MVDIGNKVHAVDLLQVSVGTVIIYLPAMEIKNKMKPIETEYNISTEKYHYLKP